MKLRAVQFSMIEARTTQSYRIKARLTQVGPTEIAIVEA